jgi:hypothetical protein
VVTEAARSTRRSTGSYFIVTAITSIVSMPITAPTFLVLGCVGLVALLAVAAVGGRRVRESPHLFEGIAGALGLLVGPALYLLLAVI